LVIIWFFMKYSNKIAKKYNCEFLISGNYFKQDNLLESDDDHSIDYKSWVYQSLLYFFLASIGKFSSYAFTIFFAEYLEKLGTYMLSSVSLYPKLELITVMVIIPFLTNCVQFWVIDNILKEPKETKLFRASSRLKIDPKFLEEILKQSKTDEIPTANILNSKEYILSSANVNANIKENPNPNSNNFANTFSGK